jgi:hypothetical protein
VFDIGWIFGADDSVIDTKDSSANDDAVGAGSIQNLDQSRNARILRLIRLLRLVRVAKLWKIVLERQKSRKQQKELSIDRSLQHLVDDFSMDELLERFKIADKGGVGHLSPTQMKYLLMSTIYASQHQKKQTDETVPTEKQAVAAVEAVTDNLFSSWDTACDGVISIQEFKQGISELRYQMEEKKERENMNGRRNLCSRSFEVCSDCISSS